MSMYKRYALRGAFVGILIAAATFAGSILLTPRQVTATDTGNCGPSAIIPCGAKTVDELITKYNAQNTNGAVARGTYSYFGIGPTELSQLKQKAVIGQVYNDFFGGHDVIVVNGKVAAVNATTAGRVYVNGSTKIGTFAGINVYKRLYHLSNHDVKQAFVLMDGNKFKFAILAECGNPVSGDAPTMSINKEISKDGQNFSENASFNDGETATFRVTVKETSNKAFLTGVKVTDNIPTGYEYVAGSTKVDGQAVTDITSGPVDLGIIDAGQTKAVTFQAKVKLLGKVCGTNHLPNTASVASDQTPSAQDDASGDVSKVCVAQCKDLSGPTSLNYGQVGTYVASETIQNVTVTGYTFKVDNQVVQDGASNTFNYTGNTPGDHLITVLIKFSNNTTSGETGDCAKTVHVKQQPSLRCDSLTAPKYNLASGEEVVFTALGSGTNMNVTGYTFKVNGQVVKDTNSAAENTYTFKQTVSGDYTVSVTVKGENNTTATSADCSKPVHVNEEIVPEYKCDLLTLSPTSVKINEKVTANVKYVANNGATFKQASFNFSDGAPVVVTSTANNSVTSDHSYATEGDRTISVNLTFTVNNQDVVVNGSEQNGCAKKITVNQIPKCPYDQTLLPNDPKCYEHCTIKGKEQYRKDDAAHCSLPNTGSGTTGLVALFGTTTFLGAFMYRLRMLRENQ